jgi:hypothetical protein
MPWPVLMSSRYDTVTQPVEVSRPIREALPLSVAGSDCGYRPRISFRTAPNHGVSTQPYDLDDISESAESVCNSCPDLISECGENCPDLASLEDPSEIDSDTTPPTPTQSESGSDPHFITYVPSLGLEPDLVFSTSGLLSPEDLQRNEHVNRSYRQQFVRYCGGAWSSRYDRNTTANMPRTDTGGANLLVENEISRPSQGQLGDSENDELEVSPYCSVSATARPDQSQESSKPADTSESPLIGSNKLLDVCLSLHAKRYGSVGTHYDEPVSKKRRIESLVRPQLFDPYRRSRSLRKRFRSSSPIRTDGVADIKKLKYIYRALYKRIKFSWSAKRLQFRFLSFHGNTASHHRQKHVNNNRLSPSLHPGKATGRATSPTISGCGTQAYTVQARKAMTGKDDGMQLYANEEAEGASASDEYCIPEKSCVGVQYPLVRGVPNLYHDGGVKIPVQLSAAENINIRYDASDSSTNTRRLETDQGIGIVVPVDIEQLRADGLHELQGTGEHCAFIGGGIRTGSGASVVTNVTPPSDNRDAPAPQQPQIRVPIRSELQCPNFRKKKKGSQSHECRTIRYSCIEELLYVPGDKYWIVG